MKAITTCNPTPKQKKVWQTPTIEILSCGPEAKHVTSQHEKFLLPFESPAHHHTNGGRPNTSQFGYTFTSFAS